MILAQSRKVAKSGSVILNEVKNLSPLGHSGLDPESSNSGITSSGTGYLLPVSLYRKETRAINSPCHPMITMVSVILSVFLFTIGTGIAQTVNVIPPRLPEILPDVIAADHSKRDQLTRILAIRVEFVRDTLTTTTGNGSFNYGYSDTIHFDPPPHDSLYFADNLEFLQFYWDEMSNGAVELSWDIFPSGMQAAYQLPKQMWQYNYNYSDEQLDRGLAELFRDAVQAADQDDAIIWNDYDLVMIFHAGAGKEFDVGFTLTPHDLPSAWMVKEDFSSQLGLDDGILVVDNGDSSYVEAGLILPETESHDDIQISMLGVLCSLFGHTLGLPGLYDSDDGQAVVGKWSLMDRGFGNFYGAIPAELDVWSRMYKGWITPTELSPKQWTITARGFAHPDTTSDTIRVGKIVISPSEYFLIENRNRDPEGDSIAVAYDRDGRRMIFKEDYTVEADDGFRVPVRIDNLDFDSPGSGILIWHVDEALYPLLREKRFNSQNDRRGLDIEEADGAQDIGQDYAFLTPGYGTDYGVFEDAWYSDNKAHRKANSYRVRFNNDSYPDSKANSGASTHITIDDFSLRGTVMTFSWSQSPYVQEGFPVEVALNDLFWDYQFIVGNFDDDPYDEIMFFGFDRNVTVIDGDGTIIHAFQDSILFQLPSGSYFSSPAAADLNGDGRDDVVTFLKGTDDQWRVVAILSDNDGYTLESVYDISTYSHSLSVNGFMIIGGTVDNHKVFVVINERDNMSYLIYDNDLSLIGEHHIGRWSGYSFLLGSAYSDTFLTVSARLGEVKIIHDDEILLDDSFNHYVYSPVLADFDGSGKQDFICNEHLIIKDIAVNGLTDSVNYVSDLIYDMIGNEALPVDVDRDGQYEILGIDDGIANVGNDDHYDPRYLIAGEVNGVLSEGFPIVPPLLSGIGYPPEIWNCKLVVDLDGDGWNEYLLAMSRTWKIDFTEPGEPNVIRASGGDSWLDGFHNDGTRIDDFPLDYYPISLNHTLCQLDDDPAIECVYIGENSVEVIEIPATNPTIWWGSEYRDKQNRNAVWEPAQPHSATSSDPIMPDNLCYNWPNPARESTAIRYFLNFDATVKVDIFDITGQRVTTLHGDGTAGQHHEIPWNTKSIARGGYLAVVEAKGNGRTESKIVKIAVVK